jgi:hypothetical protein
MKSVVETSMTVSIGIELRMSELVPSHVHVENLRSDEVLMVFVGYGVLQDEMFNIQDWDMTGEQCLRRR